LNQCDLDTYAELMHEVRLRLSVLNSFFEGVADTTYIRTNTESMCLQVRKVLELIAFSTLVSHREGYVKIRNDLGKDWHAIRILKAVELINPSFYPRPVRGFSKAKPNGKSHFVKLRNGFLSREQFVRLYDSCGDILHATNPFSTEINFNSFCLRLQPSILRIELLILEHSVQLAESKDLLWVHVPLNLSEPVIVRHLTDKSH